MSNNKFELIIEEWEANLKQKSRNAGSVVSNFEEVFLALNSAGATFDEARDLLPRIIKVHQPAPALARNTFKNLKSSPKIAGFTEKEFIDKWNKDIADKGTATFYLIFPRPKSKDEEDDDAPKVYGNMSAHEYRLQRRYTDQFPIINTEELEKRIQMGTYNPVEDIANILDDKKGDNDTVK